MWCRRAKHFSLLSPAAYDYDVTSGGGGTGRPWWTAVVQVYCGVDEQLVFKDTRHKKKILKRGCGATSGVLAITKQHCNLNDGGSPDEN